MKKTFISLFLLSLLTVFGSLPLQADDELSFVYTTWGYDNSGEHKEYYCNGNVAENTKWISDGDFNWNQSIDNVAQREVSSVKWTGVDQAQACTRSDVSFSAANYTLTLLTYRTNHSATMTLPFITIGDGKPIYASEARWGVSSTETIESNQFNYTNDNGKGAFETEVRLIYHTKIDVANSYGISVSFPSGYDRYKDYVKTLTISQDAPTYAVSATASNGSVSGTGSFAEGASVTLTASPNENYSFTGWSSSDISIANPSANPLVFTMPGNAVSVTAYFAECTKHIVTLAANNNEYGSVDGGGEQCDGSVTVTATPNTDYRFVNWTNTSTSAEVSTNAVYTFDLSADIGLTANFEVDPCSNSLTIQCEEGTYQINSALLTKGTSIPDYKLGDGWYTGADGNYVDFNDHEGEIYYIIDLPAATYSFTVYKAHAGKSYLNIWEAGIGDELTYNGVNYGKHHGDAYDLRGDDAGGHNTPIHNSTISDVALSAGTYIIGLYGNNYAVYDKVIITATSNVFCPTYDITMVNNMGGTLPTADKVKAEENASVSISAAETIGEFSFTGWTATAGSFDDASAASTTFTMPAEAVTITANYNTYSRTGAPAIQNDNYGTICLPLNGTVTGATLYSVAGSQEEGGKLYIVLEEQDNLEAGKPYIFQLSADVLSVALSGTYTGVQAGNGLMGTYTEIENLTPYDDSHHNYVLNANAFKKAGNNVTVGAYRAYLNWDAVSAAPAPAQSARRIRMVIEGKEVQTGMETVTAMPKTTKVLIDGQLFIIREGKRYTLTGARAQ